MCDVLTQQCMTMVIAFASTFTTTAAATATANCYARRTTAVAVGFHIAFVPCTHQCSGLLEDNGWCTLLLLLLLLLHHKCMGSRFDVPIQTAQSPSFCDHRLQIVLLVVADTANPPMCSHELKPTPTLERSSTHSAA
jgi:hypothetical protein